ncbi:MAG: GNAT family N-acetyltransferase [Pseudomonadota bacterium]
MDPEPLIRGLLPADVETLVRLVEATEVFRESEVAIARELAEAAASQGEEPSGYHFRVLDEGGGVRGYACFGPTPGTEGTWDLYWIVTDPAWQGRGLASRLLRAVEEAVAAQGARLLVAETSDTDLYDQARAFYLARGFRAEAHIPDFYKPGDGKLFFVKRMER